MSRLSINFCSEDPVAEAPLTGGDEDSHESDTDAGGVDGREEDEDDGLDDDEDNPPVCECDKCPDLGEEKFSRCCQSEAKAKKLCLKSKIACICDLPKLLKILDEARIIE